MEKCADCNSKIVSTIPFITEILRGHMFTCTKGHETYEFKMRHKEHQEMLNTTFKAKVKELKSTE